MLKLEPCPFCGGQAEFERVGTKTASCIIFCENCGCRLESNESGEWCGDQWNRRHYAVVEVKTAPPTQPLTTVETAPETNIQVTGSVLAKIQQLWVTTLVLVLLTGLQAAVAIKDLLIRFGIIGG